MSSDPTTDEMVRSWVIGKRARDRRARGERVDRPASAPERARPRLAEAVELRNLLKDDLELDHPLSATLMFDHPTVEAMTRYLGLEVLHIAGDAPVPGSEVDAGDTLDRIENLSDDEVDRFLAERMRSEA
jgi:hypothetical protein